MKFNSLKPELYVSNFQISLNFYTNILGFKLEYQRSNPLFAFLSYQGSQLMIQQEDEDEEWHNGKPEYPFGRGINFQIIVIDLDGIYNRLLKNGYPIKLPLEQKSYRVGSKFINVRQFMVMDPDGYLLRLSTQTGVC